MMVIKVFLDINQKPWINKVMDRGKKSKTLSEVKPVQNISKNSHSFLAIGIVQKEVLFSHELQDHAYE